MVADGVDGLMASTNVQQGSYWWLISLERDELGLAPFVKLGFDGRYRVGTAAP